MIRPSRGGVAVNMSGGMSGMPGSNMGGGNNPATNQASGADVIRGILANGSRGLSRTGTGGGFNWSSTNANTEEDALLREMLGSGNETETTNYYIEQTAKYTHTFIESILYRRAPLFNVYRGVLENFVIGRDGIPDRILKAFVEDVLKLHDFNNIVAINGAPFFGGQLIEALRGGKERLDMNDIQRGVESATRNVLYFELISWLVNSDNGRGHAYRLTDTVSTAISSLDKNIEATTTLFNHYGVPNPYADVKFEIKAVTAPDYNLMANELTNVISGGLHFNNEVTSDVDINQWVLNKARMHQEERARQTVTQPSVNYNNSGNDMWEGYRTDYDNLTVENRKEFNFNSFFKHIKDNWYYIQERDFHNVKHIMNLDPSSRIESVIGSTFRVVKINLREDHRLNYSTKLVRDDELTITDVLTNPALLLPKLENPNNLLDVWSVRNEAVEVIKADTTEELERLGVFTPREDGTTVVNYASQLNTKGYDETVETVTKLNTVLTKEETNINSVYSTTQYSTFDLRDPKVKPIVKKKLPYLFKDYENDISYEAVIKGIRSEATRETIPEELYYFLEAHLTKEFNNYLISSLGYSKTDTSNHLSVNSIIDDFDKLLNYVIDKDPKLHELLTVAEENYLTNGTKLFSYDNRFLKEDDPLAVISGGQELLVERDTLVGVINSLAGPIASKEPLVIFRSTYPEYFSLLESGIENIRGDKDIRNITKLIYFTVSKELWLFSLSELDDDVGKLTLVDRDKPLVLMNLYEG